MRIDEARKDQVGAVIHDLAIGCGFLQILEAGGTQNAALLNEQGAIFLIAEGSMVIDAMRAGEECQRPAADQFLGHAPCLSR